MDKYDVNMPAFPQFKSNAYGVKIEGGLSRREYVATELISNYRDEPSEAEMRKCIEIVDNFLRILDETKPTLPVAEPQKVQHHPV